jgi:predicted nuclease with TOPRIM domain
MAEKAADFAAVAALDEQLRALQDEKSALEDTWLELYEAVEA